jgi:Tfp pilus assembly protein FimT
LRGEEALTMIEIIVTLAILAIIAVLSAMGSEVSGTERVRGVSRELLADLLMLRNTAVTSGPDAEIPDFRGSGIRFATPNSYVLFRFNDSNGNYLYDGEGEEMPLAQEAKATRREIPEQVRIMVNRSGRPSDPADDVLLFDLFGMPRQENMGFQKMGVVTEHASLPDLQKKCVSVSFNRIREGIWNGKECDEQ